MNYKQLNEALKDLRSMRSKVKPVEIDNIKVINGEEQGEEGLKYEIYPYSELNVFIRLKIITDSYGANEQIVGVEFVSPIEKTITNYKPIN